MKIKVHQLNFILIFVFIGYLFFSALGPRPLGPSAPQFLSVQFQGLGWYNLDEILKLSIKCSYLQKYNIHYQQKNFSCLVCTWYICRQAICQLRHPHGGINKYN